MRSLVFIVLLGVTSLFASVSIFVTSAHAQIVFSADAPLLDSFPVVRVPVNVTENGGPAATDVSNFSVREDGSNIPNPQLLGCNGYPSAAIVFVVDTSISMDASVGTGPMGNKSYEAFYSSFSGFLANIPAPSQLALVPFADSATYWYPGKTRGFFNSSVLADTTELMTDVRNIDPIGRETNVDPAVVYGAQILLKSTLQKKVLVLITDDAVTEEDSLISYLRANHISLYVLEVARDSVHLTMPNQNVALRTGGKYYAAYDTSYYAPYMAQMARDIFGEHCTLRYVSTDPCPWMKAHTVDLSLSYKTAKQTLRFSYTIGENTRDSVAPRFHVDSSRIRSRVVLADDPYPCESGMRSLIDTGRSNFARVHPITLNGSEGRDSIFVIDTMYPADIYYVARDSSGNQSNIHIHYEPVEDTIAPQMAVPSAAAGLYTEAIREAMPWDRGLKSITLEPGAVNLSLDSVVYSGRSFALAFLHVIVAKDSASGCLLALDSVDNSNRLCLSYFGENNDNEPPVFTQDPIAEPRTSLSGTITETRLHDKGIRLVKVTPISNVGAGQIAYQSVAHATLSVPLTDSLYSARALVEAYDSVLNYSRDTLRYEPLADTAHPALTYTLAGTNFSFDATEIRAWDRGIRSVSLLPASTNVTTVGPSFTDVRHAVLPVAITDPNSDAVAAVEVTDSAGNVTDVTATYTASVPPLPVWGDTTIDFGVWHAPVLTQTKVAVTNPGNQTLVVTVSGPTGDDSVFYLYDPNQFPLSAHNTEILTFTFKTPWIGKWRAVYSVMSGSTRLAKITLVGQTAGIAQLSLDTVLVPHQELNDTVRLSLDVTPKPANLDSLSFLLKYNADVITMGDPVTCHSGASADTGVCLYDVAWTSGSEGNRVMTLRRRNTAVATTLSTGTTQILLPIRTHLTKTNETQILILQPTSSQLDSFVIGPGLVHVGDTCGTALIRAGMNDDLASRLSRVAPNPASTTVTLTLQNANAAEGWLEMTSASGVTVYARSVHLEKGEQTLTLRDLPEASGTYELTLKVNGVVIARRVLVILK